MVIVAPHIEAAESILRSTLPKDLGKKAPEPLAEMRKDAVFCLDDGTEIYPHEILYRAIFPERSGRILILGTWRLRGLNINPNDLRQCAALALRRESGNAEELVQLKVKGSKGHVVTCELTKVKHGFAVM